MLYKNCASCYFNETAMKQLAPDLEYSRKDGMNNP
jgi:hypothetical protein